MPASIRSSAANGADGMTVDTTAGRAVNVADFLATVCKVLGINYNKQNRTPIGRPMRIVGISLRLAASYAAPREIRSITAASLTVTTRRSGRVSRFASILRSYSVTLDGQPPYGVCLSES